MCGYVMWSFTCLLLLSYMGRCTRVERSPLRVKRFYDFVNSIIYKLLYFPVLIRFCLFILWGEPCAPVKSFTQTESRGHAKGEYNFTKKGETKYEEKYQLKKTYLSKRRKIYHTEFWVSLNRKFNKTWTLMTVHE